MQTKFENLENSEVKMTVSMDWADFEKYWANGFKKVQEFVEIDGFRKGHAPENMVTAKYGEMIIMEEMANLAINESYLSSILKENESRSDDEKVFPIDQPKVVITKLGKGSEFEYTATFAVLPKITLPDYKKIAKAEIETVLKSDEGKKDLEEVKDEEIEEILQNLAKARTPHSHTHEDGTVHGEGHAEIADVPLDDAFAQSFGPDFKTLDDLKKKVGENMKLEKESKMIERKRTAILEKLITESKCDVPEILVDSETQKMTAQMRGDIEKFGSSWSEYLAHIKKTEDDLKNEWRETAMKRAKTQLILNEIAKQEKIKPSEEEIDVEVIKIKHQVPEANENHVKDYVYQILQNEKVLKMLEN